MIRIALWSGPRNISTAMMRAWENRPDTVVWDEPLYAHYLRATGIDHPMREETLAVHDADATRVLDACVNGVPPGARNDGARIFYQKQMTHHFLDGLPWDWLDDLRNAFLIRHPRAMLLSYARKRQSVTAADLGLARQVEIFEHVKARTGRIPPVLDAEDVLRDPRGALSGLCAALDVPFDEAMLSWPAGPRDSDGAWAPHWYDAVQASTGFAPWSARDGELPDALQAVLEECLPHHATLEKHRR